MADLNSSFIPYFRELTKNQLEKIECITREYECNDGDLVFLQGEYCKSLIIVNKGSFLSRIKNNNEIKSENIYLEGEIYDFESIIKNSITSSTFESIGKSSFFVIDILALKKLSQKNPIITSLIKLQLQNNILDLWDEYILKKSNKIKELRVVFTRSFLWSIIRFIPVVLLLTVLLFLVINKIDLKRQHLVLFVYFSINLFLYLAIYLNSKLTRIDINREVIVKKCFTLSNVSKEYTSIPIEKIQSVKTLFSKRFLRIISLGTIEVESASEKLQLDGVFNPKEKIDKINSFKHNIVNVDKAIELSSFKYIMCKKNNLFTIENNLESDNNSIFSFRKSIVSLLIKIIPIIAVFSLTIFLFYKLFLDLKVLFLLTPIFFIIWWLIVDWLNDKYAFEGDKIIDIEKKPLFGKEVRIEADLVSIQSVKKIQKNIFEILFNFGNIEITILGGKIIYPSINNPDKVIDNLYLVKKYYFSKEENRSRVLRQEEFLNYTEYYQELAKK